MLTVSNAFIPVRVIVDAEHTVVYPRNTGCEVEIHSGWDNSPLHSFKHTHKHTYLLTTSGYLAYPIHLFACFWQVVGNQGINPCINTALYLVELSTFLNYKL